MIWRIISPFIPHIAIAALLLGCVAWIDHRGYKRAEADAEARWKEQIAIAAAETRRIEGAIGGATQIIDRNTAARVNQIRVNRQTIVQNITKEVINDPRYSDPDNALSDGVWKNINRARSESAVARSASVIEYTLPAATHVK